MHQWTGSSLSSLLPVRRQATTCTMLTYCQLDPSNNLHWSLNQNTKIFFLKILLRYMSSAKWSPFYVTNNHWNGKVVRVTTLAFTGDVEARFNVSSEYQSCQPGNLSVYVLRYLPALCTCSRCPRWRRSISRWECRRWGGGQGPRTCPCPPSWACWVQGYSWSWPSQTWWRSSRTRTRTSASPGPQWYPYLSSPWRLYVGHQWPGEEGSSDEAKLMTFWRTYFLLSQGRRAFGWRWISPQRPPWWRRTVCPHVIAEGPRRLTSRDR